MIFEGTVHVVGDHCDTDVMIPGRYLSLVEPAEIAKHIFEEVDPGFVKRVKPGDILIAGRNFGSGSGREHAPFGLKALGLSCIIATSFSRTFYRMAIDLGLPILTSEEVARAAKAGQRCRVDTSSGEIALDGQVFRTHPMPQFIQDIIEEGGLTPWVKREAAKASGSRRLIMRLAIALLSGGIAALSSWTHAAQSGEYPSRPVRLVVVYPPGGGVDVLARGLAQRFSENWGVPVVVDNRPGAGTTLGAAIAAKSPPDGHTLLLTDVSLAITPALYASLPYRVEQDLAPISLLNLVTDVLVVHPAVPAQSVRDLVQYAKSNPGKLSYASAGNGTLNHLAPEMFKAQAGIDLVHIPYKGAVAAISDVMAGRAQVYIGALGTALPQIRANRLRALAITGRNRAPQLPELPTVAEQGLPNYDVSAWYALLAPAGTPSAVIDKVQVAAKAGIENADIRARLLADGAEPVGSTAAELRAFLRIELNKWGQAVKAAGVKVD